eukprot:6729623-Pyramimonas_sp.AAC.1
MGQVLLRRASRSFWSSTIFRSPSQQAGRVRAQELSSDVIKLFGKQLSCSGPILLIVARGRQSRRLWLRKPAST